MLIVKLIRKDFLGVLLRDFCGLKIGNPKFSIAQKSLKISKIGLFLIALASFIAMFLHWASASSSIGVNMVLILPEINCRLRITKSITTQNLKKSPSGLTV